MSEQHALEEHKDFVTELADAQGLSRIQYWKTICATAMPAGKPVSIETVLTFLAVAREYGLNPLTKEIYAFEAGGGIRPIVSVDGWLKLANKNPDFDGLNIVELSDGGGKVAAIRVEVYRKSRSHPIVVTEYMSECARDTQPWKKWPIRMLRNKAIIQGLRVAFSFAGIYEPDEAERMVSPEEATLSTIGELKQKMSSLQGEAQDITPEPLFEAVEVAADPVAEVSTAATDTAQDEPDDWELLDPLAVMASIERMAGENKDLIAEGKRLLGQGKLATLRALARTVAAQTGGKR